MVRHLKQKLDYSDYAAIPTDRNRYEILDGELVVTPAPTPLHQRVSKRLQRQLEEFFETGGRGEVFNAPIDVILSNHDVVQPDLVVVLDAAQISSRGIEGAPTLLVEVLSPSSRHSDKSTKAKRYAALGVRHYWIVDPEARRIECYRQANGEYALLIEAIDDGSFTHPDWPGLRVELRALWA